MKKVIASVAVILYFTLACGVIVNYHFCMDRYDSFRLYKATSDYCTRCGMHTKSHGCCHDVVKIVRLQNDHQTSTVTFESKNLAVAINTPGFISTAIIPNDLSPISNYHSPPGSLPPVDLCINYCVFRV